MSFSYNTESKNKARSLRRTQTETERFLWFKIRGRQLAGHKFYRQYPIGRYIIDFYCPAKRLAVELDGGQHVQQTKYDDTRSDFLRKQKIVVLRFWDNEVFMETNEVLEKIYLSLKVGD